MSQINNKPQGRKNQDDDQDYKDLLEQAKASKNKDGDREISPYALKFQAPDKKKGSTTVTYLRILPYPHNPKNRPFVVAHTHYDLGKKNAPQVCLHENFGEKCPICDFSEEPFELTNTIARKRGIDSKDRAAKKSVAEINELFKYGYKMKAKARVYCPVIVRGKEEEGVKFWGMNHDKQYIPLLEEIAEVEGMNPLNRYNGYDVKVTVTNDGTGFNKTTVSLMSGKQPKPAIEGSTEDIDALIDGIQDIWKVYLEKPTGEKLASIVESVLRPDMNAIADGQTTASKNETSSSIGNRPPKDEDEEDLPVRKAAPKRVTADADDDDAPAKKNGYNPSKTIDDLDNQLDYEDESSEDDEY